MNNYVETNLYCVNCGSKSVWLELGAGEAYEGDPIHICIECVTHFELPSNSTYYSKETLKKIAGTLSR